MTLHPPPEQRDKASQKGIEGQVKVMQGAAGPGGACVDGVLSPAGLLLPPSRCSCCGRAHVAIKKGDWIFAQEVIKAVPGRRRKRVGEEGRGRRKKHKSWGSKVNKNKNGFGRLLHQIWRPS